MKVIDETKKVAQRMKAATITSLGRASAYIRGIARRSISTRKKGEPNPPGRPPRSPTKRLKDAIVFSVDKPAGEAVIGPTLTVIGRIGSTHEFGGTEPPKRRSSRARGAFDIRVGGFGPIRVAPGPAPSRRRNRNNTTRSTKRVIVGRLKTARQVQRAQRIIAEAQIPPSQSGLPEVKSRTYPARPFMGPALERSRERIPNFWKNVLKRS